MMAIRSSGMFLPNIVSANTSLGLGQGTVVDIRTFMYEIRKLPKMKVSLTQEDPHHRLAPRDILERPLVRGQVGDDALQAFRRRERAVPPCSCMCMVCGCSVTAASTCRSPARGRSTTAARTAPARRGAGSASTPCTARRQAGPRRLRRRATPWPMVRPQATRPPSRCRPCSAVSR